MQFRVLDKIIVAGSVCHPMLFPQAVQRLHKVLWVPVRTATKRASGGNKATNNTAGRRLGPKAGEGQFVKAGEIVWRQRGTKWYPGENAGMGRDHTIFAREPGFVRYYRDPFHAKRKFIGVALGAQDRLPTPHFEPRRRRFGFKPIDNEEVAEFENQYLSKKEVERLQERERLSEVAAQKRAKIAETYAAALRSLVADLEDSDVDHAVNRLLKTRTYMNGGFSFEKAREITDSHYASDLLLDVKAGRKTEQEHKELAEKILSSNKKVDAGALLALVDDDLMVVKFETPERQKELRAATLDEIEKLCGEHEVTPASVIEQFENLLKFPFFSTGDRVNLRRKHLRRPLPIAVDKTSRKEYESKVKSGEGEFRQVWLSSVGHMKEYYVPKGATMIFD